MNNPDSKTRLHPHRAPDRRGDHRDSGRHRHPEVRLRHGRGPTMATVISDLKNFASQQEVYHGDNMTYAYHRWPPSPTWSSPKV